MNPRTLLSSIKDVNNWLLTAGMNFVISSLVLLSLYTFGTAGGSTLGTSTLTLKPIQDTTVKEDYADKNYGTAAELVSDGKPKRIPYVQYDLSELKSDQTITGAILRVYTTSTAETRKVKKAVKVVSNNTWSETAMTWNNKPSMGTIIGNLNNVEVKANSTYNITLNASALQPYAGKKFSLAIDDTVQSPIMTISSRETAAKAPELILTINTPDAPVNQAPTAVFTASPTSGNAPLTVAFDASQSSDPDGNVVTYSWNFGNGSTGSGVTATQTYSTAGTYTITLTVTDNAGATNSKTATVTVATAPVTNTNVTLNAVADSHVKQYYGTKNYGTAVTLEADEMPDSGSAIISFIKFDLTPYAGQTLQTARLKLTVYNGSGDKQNIKFLENNSWTETGITYLTKPATSALPSVITLEKIATGQVLDLDVKSALNQYVGKTLTVAIEGAGSDRLVLNSRETFDVSQRPQLVLTMGSTGGTTPPPPPPPAPVNQPPVAKISAVPLTGNAPLSVAFNGTGSTDSDGTVASYAWNFGNGATATGATVSYTYNSVGTYNTVLTVTDNAGAQSSASVSINVTQATLPPPPPPPPPPPSSSTTGIWLSRAEIQALPITGDAGCASGSECSQAWQNVLIAASNNFSYPKLSDQEDNRDVYAYASALVWARTGNETYRAKTATAISNAMNTEDGGRTLALARNLLPLVVSADIIDLKNYNPTLNSQFVTWLSAVRTETLDGMTLISTHDKRPNNWGTHAAASRIAADLYLNDTTDLQKAINVHKGWLGDRSAYSGFSYGDLCYQSNPSQPRGINPLGATLNIGGVARNADGILPDDLRRAGCPPVYPYPKENYVWEALQGATVATEMLHRAGYDAYSWSDKALFRSVNWLHAVNNFPAVTDDRWIPWVINKRYGTNFPAQTPVGASQGKNIGYTEWTHR